MTKADTVKRFKLKAPGNKVKSEQALDASSAL
jgi:hypothetical protein